LYTLLAALKYQTIICVKIFQLHPGQESQHQEEELYNRCANSSQSVAMQIVGSYILRYSICLNNYDSLFIV